MTQTPHPLPIRAAFQEGWQRTQANLRPFAFLGLFNLLLTVAQQPTLDPERSARPLFGLALQILHVGIWLVYVRWALAACDGRSLSGVADTALLRGFLPFLGSVLLYGLTVMGGLVLFVIPGLVWAVRFAFASTLVVDRQLDPWAAFRESARLTQGHRWPLLGFGLLCLGLNALGACLMGVGLILTLPVTFIAQAHLLRHLQTRASEATTPPSPAPLPSPAHA